MRPIDKVAARHHTDLSEERYHVDGRLKRLTKQFAKRKASKASRRALAKSISLELAPRFLRRIEGAKKSLQQGRGVKFENVDWS